MKLLRFLYWNVIRCRCFICMTHPKLELVAYGVGGIGYNTYQCPVCESQFSEEL